MGEAHLTALAMVGGYLLDLCFGDPAWLPHPVVGFGRLAAWGERLLNRGGRFRRFVAGAFLTCALVGAAFVVAGFLQSFAWRLHPAVGATVVVLGVFLGLANRTLIAEARAVFHAVATDLVAGRRQLSRIVGRDTASLDARQVRLAALESLAENLSDGVVAPLFWFALLGLPGLIAYKMINTLDSMIGHRDERFEQFGKAAARLDDLANLVPARLTALLQCLLAGSARGFAFVLRYGRAHASPNSGYPEAALAGILDLRFGGPHTYDGELVLKPWIGANPREVGAVEIVLAVRLNHAVALVVVLATAGWWWQGSAPLFLP